jgi:hypothetical protein
VLPFIAEMTGIHHFIQQELRWGLLNLLVEVNFICLIAASQVARITGVSLDTLSSFNSPNNDF